MTYDRIEVGVAHYKGDVRSSFEDKPYGPNYNHELFWPLYIEYDEATKMSTVHFTRTPPEGMYGNV